MPAHKSAIKRIKQSDKNHLRNVSTKSALKTLRKEFLQLLPAKKDEAAKSVSDLQSAVDKAAKRGIIHRNKARRMKSRLMQHLNTAGAPAKA